MIAPPVYPATPGERARWVRSLRGPRNPLDPRRAYAAFLEHETDSARDPVTTAVLLLTNRECPFTCTMCDLWQNTLTESVPPGAIPEQIRYALAPLGPARQIKLYNAGSFFDPRAIPPSDYPAIAALLEPFERVIVECHPAFINQAVTDFQRMLSGRLEVAIGLETVHTEALALLNKGFTLGQFDLAAGALRQAGIDLRTFLLVRPPGLSEAEGVEWACRSIEASFDAGATACCVIPTRGGNGAMEALQAAGTFTPPSLRSLESAQRFGLEVGRGRVFADLWDIERLFSCECSPQRAENMAQMNRHQRPAPAVPCELCASPGAHD